MIEEVGQDIWLVEGGNVDFIGFPYSTRMVIVRLPDQSLWVWSPIALTDELKHRVNQSGRVAHLVSPNKIHHLFLGEWQMAWPDAKLWGPQSTIEKRFDLTFQPALDAGAPAEWGDTFDLFHFTGSKFMDELVFFHRSSSTAILADLSENFTDEFLEKHWSWWKRLIAGLWKIKEPHGKAPLEWRLSFLNKKKARQARDGLLACNPEKVIMAHGRWQREKGRAFLEQSLSWLG